MGKQWHYCSDYGLRSGLCVLGSLDRMTHAREEQCVERRQRLIRLTLVLRCEVTVSDEVCTL